MYKIAKVIGIISIIFCVMNFSYTFALNDVINSNKTDLSTNIYVIFNILLIVVPLIILGLIMYNVLKKNKLCTIRRKIIATIIIVVFLFIYVYGCVFLLNYNNLFSGIYY